MRGIRTGLCHRRYYHGPIGGSLCEGHHQDISYILASVVGVDILIRVHVAHVLCVQIRIPLLYSLVVRIC
jgi:hypothetical protein